MRYVFIVYRNPIVALVHCLAFEAESARTWRAHGLTFKAESALASKYILHKNGGAF